jgi:hypothetical protein
MEKSAIALSQSIIFCQDGLAQFDRPARVVARIRFVQTRWVSVRMGVQVGMGKFMLLAVVMSWAMLVVVFMNMHRFAAAMGVLMFMRMRVSLLVIVAMGTDSHSIFSRQSAAAFFTHYSISTEASSSSLPPRSSPPHL